MRFLTHPLLFYPLALIVAGLIVLIGLEPQRWAREPRPIEAERQGETLVLAGDAFDAPSPSPDQNMKVVRNFWGEAQALRIAVLPGQPEPTPAERGVRILLSPEDAAFIEDRPVVVEVSYDVMTMNTAPALAVSLQGIAPADWVRQDVPAEPGVLRHRHQRRSGLRA